MLNAATILATLALCAAALPSPNSNLPTRAIVEHNGRQIDCNKIAFLAVMPPSELELKCRGAQGLPSAFDIQARAIVEHNGRRVDCDATPSEPECRVLDDILTTGKRSENRREEVDIQARAVVEHNGRQVDCSEIAFLAVMPPSELELKCRAAVGSGKRSETLRTGIVLGKRQVVDFEGGKLNCANLVFPAVFPPSEAEVACRGG